MNASVKSSHPLRFVVLGTAAVLLICFALFRGDSSRAQLPSMLNLTRHDSLHAAPPATMAQTETSLAKPMALPADATIAAPPSLATSAPANALADEERTFFERAGQAGIQQDKVSRGVLNQLNYPEVREYVYTLLDEQAALNAELLELAARKQVVVPAPERVPFRRWSHEEGSIDQHYVNLLLESNTEAVTLYEQAARSDDPEIAAFARKALPVIQRRLAAVHALKKITD